MSAEDGRGNNTADVLASKEGDEQSKTVQLLFQSSFLPTLGLGGWGWESSPVG